MELSDIGGRVSYNSKFSVAKPPLKITLAQGELES